MSDGPHQRRCFTCGNVAEHADSIVPHVLCKKCGSQDTRIVRPKEPHLPRIEIECLARVPLAASAITAVYGMKDSDAMPKHAVRNICLSHERLRAELDGSEIVRRDDMNEVASVLMMLDELAELWGDEGKFRACRDRLRKLIPAAIVGGSEPPSVERVR